MVAGIAGTDRHRVIIVENALQRGGGLEIDDADVALAAGDSGRLAQRRARIDGEGGGQAVGPLVAIGQLRIAASLRLLAGERADGDGPLRLAPVAIRLERQRLGRGEQFARLHRRRGFGRGRRLAGADAGNAAVDRPVARPDRVAVRLAGQLRIDHDLVFERALHLWVGVGQPVVERLQLRLGGGIVPAAGEPRRRHQQAGNQPFSPHDHC